MNVVNPRGLIPAKHPHPVHLRNLGDDAQQHVHRGIDRQVIEIVISHVGNSEDQGSVHEEEALLSLGPWDAIVDLLPEREPIVLALTEIVGGALDPVEEVEEHLSLHHWGGED